MKQLIACVIVTACSRSPDEAKAQQAVAEGIYETWCEFGDLIPGISSKVGLDCDSVVQGSITVTCQAQQPFSYRCTWDNQCPPGYAAVPLDPASTRFDVLAVSSPWNYTVNGGYSCDESDWDEVCAGSRGNPVDPPLDEERPVDAWIEVMCQDPGTCAGQWARTDGGGLYCNIVTDRCAGGFQPISWAMPPQGTDPAPRVGDPCSCNCTWSGG